MVRSGGKVMLVVAELLLFVVFESKVGESTFAVLVMLEATFDASATVRVIDELPPLAIALEFVQVTVCPEALQLHPVPVPETNVMPVGKVSLTMMEALALCGPALLTVSV